MAAPAIALRFRETTPGIETVAVHRQLIAEHGAVFWGWWKKDWENVDIHAVRRTITPGHDNSILLIDRSTSRAFRATCRRFALANELDANDVPAYYRKYIDRIAGFFLLTAIVDIANADFPTVVSDALGEKTLVWIGEAPEPGLGHIAASTVAAGRNCILHLSDLHFGAEYGFREQGQQIPFQDARVTLTESLVADLKRLGREKDIAAVIVTGDFVSRGDWSAAITKAAIAEFDALRQSLGLPKEHIIAVPGNHDITRFPDGTIDVADVAVGRQATTEHESPFRHFVRQLANRHEEASLNYVRRIQMQEFDLLLCALNSCVITATELTEYGYVGKNGMDAIELMSTEPIKRPTFRFLALHHHLLPVANVERPNSKGVTLTLDASAILGAAQRVGVNIVLHGHQHKPKVAIYQGLPMTGDRSTAPVHVVANGSAGVENARLPDGERNTYCLFQLRNDHVELRIRELRIDGVEGGQVFEDVLDTMAATPASFLSKMGDWASALGRRLVSSVWV